MNDFEWGREDRAIIEAARHAPPASAIERARVRKAVDARLLAGATIGLSLATPAFATGLKVLFGVVVGAGVTLGVMRFEARHENARATTGFPARARAAPSRVEPASSASDFAPRTEPPLAEEVPSETAALDVSPAPKSNRRHGEAKVVARGGLEEELALLGAISQLLRQGDTAKARRLLDEYDRRFRDGALAEERGAAGILVDCSSGLEARARKAARSFVVRWPQSPQLVRLRASCVADEFAK